MIDKSNRIITDINELPVYQIEAIAKALKIEFVINNGNQISIVRKDR